MRKRKAALSIVEDSASLMSTCIESASGDDEGKATKVARETTKDATRKGQKAIRERQETEGGTRDRDKGKSR